MQFWLNIGISTSNPPVKELKHGDCSLFRESCSLLMVIQDIQDILQSIKQFND